MNGTTAGMACIKYTGPGSSSYRTSSTYQSLLYLEEEGTPQMMTAMVDSDISGISLSNCARSKVRQTDKIWIPRLKGVNTYQLASYLNPFFCVFENVGNLVTPYSMKPCSDPSFQLSYFLAQKEPDFSISPTTRILQPSYSLQFQNVVTKRCVKSVRNNSNGRWELASAQCSQDSLASYQRYAGYPFGGLSPNGTPL
jgi:hypothetical protein